MNAPAAAFPRILHTVLTLSAAASLAGCSEDLIGTRREQAECLEPFRVQPEVAALADSLLVVALNTPALTAEQEQRLKVERETPTAGRVLVARVAQTPVPMLQPGREFVLTVSPSRSFLIVGQQLTGGPEAYSFVGRIAGENGTLRLVLSGQGIHGSLYSMPADGLQAVPYSIQPLGGGLHAITCLDPRKFLPD